MKVLISGCSLSSGWGFTDGVNDDRIWPNILGQKLDASITNISTTGYDNSGIFLKTLEKINDDSYDLILMQFTDIYRIIVSPNINGHRLITSSENVSNGFVNDDDYRTFHRVLTVINQGHEHWDRLIRMLDILQNYSKKGLPIRFINGMIGWNRDFFEKNTSEFMSMILDEDNLPDDEILKGRSYMNLSKRKIDLGLWINPFDKFLNYQVDNVAPNDGHPGPKSHKIIADKLYDPIFKILKNK